MIGLRAATKLGVVLAITLLAAGVAGLRAQGASQAVSESCTRASFRLVVDAGFEQTVLLITATARWRGLVERAARANSMHANLFISIHHDSVPDNLKQSWDY